MASYYCEGSNRADQVRRLFSKIAGRYDLINDLQSAGMHRFWKHRLILALQLRPQDRVLDLACGSGDLTFRTLKQQPQAYVVGGDFTLPMLKIARNRSQKLVGHHHHPSQEPVRLHNWVNLDALSMPFKKDSFDAVMIAYGLRNIANVPLAIREIARVLKVGGKIAVLEFSRPSNPFLRALDDGCLRIIPPAFGWLFFRDRQTYRYIYESLMQYPTPDGICHLLEEEGFIKITCQNLGLETMTVHTAVKTAPP